MEGLGGDQVDNLMKPPKMPHSSCSAHHTVPVRSDPPTKHLALPRGCSHSHPYLASIPLRLTRRQHDEAQCAAAGGGHHQGGQQRPAGPGAVVLRLLRRAAAQVGSQTWGCDILMATPPGSKVGRFRPAQAPTGEATRTCVCTAASWSWSVQCRFIGGDKVPEFWGKPSAYTGGTDFLGTPKNHMEVRMGGFRGVGVGWGLEVGCGAVVRWWLLCMQGRGPAAWKATTPTWIDGARPACRDKARGTNDDVFQAALGDGGA